jgi:hypothetical protein
MGLPVQFVCQLGFSADHNRHSLHSGLCADLPGLAQHLISGGAEIVPSGFTYRPDRHDIFLSSNDSAYPHRLPGGASSHE